MKMFIGKRRNGKSVKLLKFAEKNMCDVITTTYAESFALNKLAIKHGVNVMIYPHFEKEKSKNKNIVIDEAFYILRRMFIGFEIKAISAWNGKEEK